MATLDEAEAKSRVGPLLTVALLVAVVLRALYHFAYLLEVPFSLVTFSDGRQYELAALDLLHEPPWGTAPFYLQGIYAYQMAIAFAIKPWVSLALLFQLTLAGLTHVWFFRTMARWRGRREAAWTTLALLSFPMLAFYENKFLTASLAVTASVAVLWAAVRYRDVSSKGRAVALGVCLGAAVLVRPNFALVIPIVGWGLWRAGARWGTLGAVALGLVLSLAPMGARNLAVTGRATVLPAHGGGTSFYIGNNAQARGVWNDAGGLLSGDVSREREELRERLGVRAADDATEIAAIGDALYARAWNEIADDPLRWGWLEVRKAWLLIGNDELTQDYDRLGEQEMLMWSPRLGIPFGVALLFALFGIRSLRGDHLVASALLGLVVATVAANLLYFTSAQHRLPLLVPCAVLLPAGVRSLRSWGRSKPWPTLAVVAVAMVSVGWPRSKQTVPTAVHYYNVSIAWVEAGYPSMARSSLDQAVARRPDHPVIRLQRARMLRLNGEFGRARDDLDAIDALPSIPLWVKSEAARERERLAAWGF